MLEKVLAFFLLMSYTYYMGKVSKTAIVLWGIFSILWFMDAWLSIQFINEDVLYEANPFLRWAVITSGTANILWVIKAVVFWLYTYGFYHYAQVKPRITNSIMVVLILLMVYINILSWNMVF